MPKTTPVLPLIAADRSYFMGIAMLLVILYHFTCWGDFPRAFFPFHWGYIGVDVFLFVSAFGLCFSWQKYRYAAFLRRRLVRIMPLFLLSAAIDSAFYIGPGGGRLSTWDWLCNLTSLSYYELGGFQRDWYLSALLLLYVLFPLLYAYVRRFRLPGIVLTLAVAAPVVGITPGLDVLHNCLISRIPVFLSGIACWFAFMASRHPADASPALPAWAIGLTATAGVALVALEVSGLSIRFMFLASALLTPALLRVCAWCRGHIAPRPMRWLRFMGRHSLEFYIANLCVKNFIFYCPITNSYAEAAFYFAANGLIALLLIPVNRACSRLLMPAGTRQAA